MDPVPTGRGVVIGCRSMAAAAGVLVLALALAAVVMANRGQTTHSGGDPGGRLLAELRPVATAVPAAAHVISREYREASWFECEAAPGSGWTFPEVSVHFSTPMPSDQVVDRVGQELMRTGWQLEHTSTTAWRAPPGAPSTYSESIWSRRLSGGAVATATLHSSDQWHDWWLYASAPPVGNEFPGNC